MSTSPRSRKSRSTVVILLFLLEWIALCALGIIVAGRELIQHWNDPARMGLYVVATALFLTIGIRGLVFIIRRRQSIAELELTFEGRSIAIISGLMTSLGSLGLLFSFPNIEYQLTGGIGAALGVTSVFAGVLAKTKTES